MRLTLALILAGLCLAPCLIAQDFPLVYEADEPLPPFPGAVPALDRYAGPAVVLGDATGDGVADFIIRESTEFSSFGSYRFLLYSGADGSVVRVLYGNGFLTSSAFLIRGVGDLTGDARADTCLVVRGAFPVSAGTSLAAVAIDSANGATLWVSELSSTIGPNDQVANVVRMNDLNGDGVGDLALLAQGSAGFGGGVGASATRVLWLSGADGTVLHELVDGLRIIETIANAGDTNGDGFDDLVIAAPTSPFVAPNAGGASLVSGADFSYLRFWNGTAANDNFATSAIGAGDVNGDGFADVMITARGADAAFIYSGQDGSLIASYPLGVAGQSVLSLVARASFDWDGDGTADYLLFNAAPPSNFSYEVRSGADFATLWTSIHPVFADVNGDGLPESIEVESGVANPFLGVPPEPRSIKVVAHKGAQVYGAGSGGLALSWEPLSSQPAVGDFVLSGGTPGASVVVAGSAQPTNEIIFGTTFPLLVSAQPADLFLQLNLNLNAAGGLRALVSLTQPALAGNVLYYQWAELSPNPGTSNAMQLLFDL